MCGVAVAVGSVRVVRAAGLRFRGFEAVRVRVDDVVLRVRDFAAALARDFDRGLAVALVCVDAADGAGVVDGVVDWAGVFDWAGVVDCAGVVDRVVDWAGVFDGVGVAAFGGSAASCRPALCRSASGRYR